MLVSKLLGYKEKVLYPLVDGFLHILASKDPACALLAKFLSMKWGRC